MYLLVPLQSIARHHPLMQCPCLRYIHVHIFCIRIFLFLFLRNCLILRFCPLIVYLQIVVYYDHSLQGWVVPPAVRYWDLSQAHPCLLVAKVLSTLSPA